MQGLTERDDRNIINTDKGGAIVIMNSENYVAERGYQLNDTNS